MVREVITVSPNANLLEAIRMMYDQKLGSLIAVNDEDFSPDGILSKSDVLRMVAEGKNPSLLRVRDVMSSDLIVVATDTPLYEAIRIMAEKTLKRLPVVDLKNYKVPRLVGILTQSLVLKRLSRTNDTEALKRIICGDLSN